MVEQPYSAQPMRPPADGKGLIAWLDDKREQGNKSLPDLQMKMNLAFVLGHQWVVWDGNRRALRLPSTRSDDVNASVRITANKIGGIVERAIAKLTKNAPLPECRPSSDDDVDVSSARVATRILSHELDRLQWDETLVKLLFWPVTLGWSYLLVHWDPEEGPVAGILEEEGQDPEELKQGEVAIEIVPAFELSVDPNARDMRTAKWAVRTTTMSREAVWEKWGEKVQGTSGEAVHTIVDDVRSLSTIDANRKTMSDWVAVHQFWMVPCRAAPKGMIVTWAGEQILERKETFPYEHGRLPFIEIDLLPGIGTREGRTWVNDLIPLQVDYNDARSREATIRRQLVPKILAPAGSIDPSRVTSRVEVITYNPTGQPPQMLQSDAGWMQQFEMGMSRADQEMGERAGQSEVTQGSAPSTMPAAAILALQETDDTKLAISAKLLAAFIRDVGWHILMLTKQYWTEERTVRTYSEENVIDVRRYKGTDIADLLDVHVVSDSALPRSKSARVQLALELHARGVIASGTDLIRVLDLPGYDFIVREHDVDTQLQARELSYLLKGGLPNPLPFHNHRAHLEFLNSYRKSLDYEQLDPKIRAAVDAHAAVHEGLLLPQEASPGAPGTPYNPELGGPNPEGVTGMPPPPPYMDPMTGSQPDPTAAAAGQGPSALAGSNVEQMAGIGQAAGQPGRVPGIPADNQAASMGN